MKQSVKSIRLWARGYRVLSLISQAPYSVSQIAELEFTSVKKASQRTKKYFDAGMAHRLAGPCDCPQGKGEFIYWVSNKGRSIVSGGSAKAFYGSANVRQWSAARINHQLQINQFHVSMELFCRQAKNLKCEFFHSCRHSGGLREMGLIPDAILILRNERLKKRLLHFVEVDLGTEPIQGDDSSSIETKLNKYLEYFDSAGYDKDFPGMQGFRVLFVVDGSKRAGSIMKLADEMQTSFVLATTLDAVNSESVCREIWLSPTCNSKVRLIKSLD